MTETNKSVKIYPSFKVKVTKKIVSVIMTLRVEIVKNGYRL